MYIYSDFRGKKKRYYPTHGNSPAIRVKDLMKYAEKDIKNKEKKTKSHFSKEPTKNTSKV